MPYHIPTGSEICREQSKDGHYEGKYPWKSLMHPWDITVMLMEPKIVF